MIRKAAWHSGMAAAVFMIAGVAAAQSTYYVEPLGDIDGGDFWSRAFALNDNGWIVGESKNTEGNDPRRVAVIWRPGMQSPEILQGADAFDFSRDMTINEDNVIGGFVQSLDPYDDPRAFIYTDDNGLDFFVDEDNNPDIRGSRMDEVSDFGKVVGWLILSDADNGRRGYIYDMSSEALTMLNPLQQDGNLSFAHGVNALGDIVGTSSDRPELRAPRLAVIWPDGSTDPQLIPGLDSFYAQYTDAGAAWIGPDGLILGNAGNRDDENRLFAQNEAWLWDPNTETASSLGFLPGYDWVDVRAINNDGSMIGGHAYLEGEHTLDFIDQWVGIVWTRTTGWVNVNDLVIGGATDYRIVEISGIAEDGTLCGTAINADRQVEAVRLSPACLTLDVDNLVAGETTMFTISGGTPGARTAVLAGFGGAPSTFVDVNNWCATFGFDVRVKGRKIKMVFTGNFDGSGTLIRERKVRSNVQGLRVLFQAAEQGTCPTECMSNIVDRVIQ